MCTLEVGPEVHDVATLDPIVFAGTPQCACLLEKMFSLTRNEITSPSFEKNRLYRVR